MINQALAITMTSIVAQASLIKLSCSVLTKDNHKEAKIVAKEIIVLMAVRL
jgi:hypothetical protein